MKSTLSMLAVGLALAGTLTACGSSISEADACTQWKTIQRHVSENQIASSAVAVKVDGVVDPATLEV